MELKNQLTRAILLVALAAEPGGLIETAQQKSYEITGKDVATLKCDKGKSTLSSGDQS